MVAFHDPLDAIGWTLHVQLALLEAPWPQDLLQHPQAKVDVCPEGKLLFRGLRVRMAINTGVPAEIIVRFLAAAIFAKSALAAAISVTCDLQYRVFPKQVVVPIMVRVLILYWTMPLDTELLAAKVMGASC